MRIMVSLASTGNAEANYNSIKSKVQIQPVSSIVGPFVSYPDQKDRRLYDASAQHKICECEMPWLDVHYAVDYVRVGEPKNQPKTALDRLFESRIKDRLFREHKFVSFYIESDLPDDVKRVERDIDVYLYDQKDASRPRRRVWVGECKLRERGNEIKLIDSEDMSQLGRKLRAVTTYETSPDRESAEGEAEITGLVVSNAFDIDEDAKRIAFTIYGENGISKVEFWQATLEREWWKSPTLKIVRLERKWETPNKTRHFDPPQLYPPADG